MLEHPPPLVLSTTSDSEEADAVPPTMPMPPPCFKPGQFIIGNERAGQWHGRPGEILASALVAADPQGGPAWGVQVRFPGPPDTTTWVLASSLDKASA